MATGEGSQARGIEAFRAAGGYQLCATAGVEFVAAVSSALVSPQIAMAKAGIAKQR